MQLVKLSVCSLNQWALDWTGNLDRIKESVKLAKQQGSTLRVGPELEISGYGLLDHFLETDTYYHSQEMLQELLKDDSLYDIVIDVGLCMLHRGNRYNCRVICLNGKILLIRPKLWLANDGVYREQRYFTPWGRPQHVEEYRLPAGLRELHDTATVPIGDAILSFDDATVGIESCEELFTPQSPHIGLSLNGSEIIINSSGSHHSLRKLDTRISLLTEASRKCGGVYLYSNLQGGDGDRLYYDGCCMIIVNGEIVAQGSQFSTRDVECITAVVDLDAVRAFRIAPSRGLQSLIAPVYQRVMSAFSLSNSSNNYSPLVVPSHPQPLRKHLPEEEIALGPANWLWDFLRRSRQAGFLIPLSGGIDSCSSATLVFSMCREVIKGLEEGNEQVKADVQRIAGVYGPDGWLPKTPQELCNRILHTVYLGMEKQSSDETRSRAKRLAEAIGSYHLDVNIDDAFTATKGIFSNATGFEPNFRAHGGTQTENLALQNIQARLRMVNAYYFAQMLPMKRERPGGGSLLVLGSGNVDEALRGYLTKYDCSSADINPIGSISKTDLRLFIRYAASAFDLPILHEFLDASPSAELEPRDNGYVQDDEIDMQMTYAQLSKFGRLRKEGRLGPYSMFLQLLHDWKDQLSPRQIATQVKKFHHFYAINRHKSTVLTPAYHAEAYDPEDNRFDLRPFCYPSFWESWSFKKIDEVVEKLEKDE